MTAVRIGIAAVHIIGRAAMPGGSSRRGGWGVGLDVWWMSGSRELRTRGDKATVAVAWQASQR